MQLPVMRLVEKSYAAQRSTGEIKQMIIRKLNEKAEKNKVCTHRAKVQSFTATGMITKRSAEMGVDLFWVFFCI